MPKTTTEIVDSIGGRFNRECLRRLVDRGWIKPVGRSASRGHPREFRDEDLERIRLAWKFKQDGYTWDAACEKADFEFKNPSLLDQE